ncbi:MAG TPA: GntR family transcriptional regulator [Solirubrobacteraceae bacterium]|nr:GntR family transcriptional regulator [Solirubrobacteraceae bacterium]
MEQLRRTTASQELFALLRDDILAGRYAAGEKLPSQRTLAREYGLNATTVREAIKRLEQLRLVDVRHGDAMRVSDWRTASGLDVIAHVLFDGEMGLNRDTLRALMEARRWMLSVAAGLAAERRTDAQADELRALARVAAREQTADFTFFAGVVEAAGNIVFTLILNSVRPIYFEHAALFDGLVTPDQEAMYEAAADAIARRDADAARTAVAELAERQERALEEALDG